ncbi:hypothetical protein RJ641_032816 [Dillenia turbinata]|uniref:Uncharacterized protein n=1 Tax=Dillenia turbinata TaxID=194707 RepID=A0AAN8VU16_9MAGN
MTADDLSSGDLIALISTINVNCEQPFTERLKQLMEQKGPDDDRIVCIIYDGIMHFSEAAASHLSLPSVILPTSSTATMLTYAAFPQLRQEGHIPVQDSAPEDMVPGLHPIRFKDLPLFHFGDLDSLFQLIARVQFKNLFCSHLEHHGLLGKPTIRTTPENTTS